VSKQAYSKAKGREGENAVVAYLRSRGIKAERRRLTGAMDAGDIAGWHLVTVEVKACKTQAYGPWLDEAEAEGANADKRFHGGIKGRTLVVAKRRGCTDTSKWFAVMTLEQAVDVLQNDRAYMDQYRAAKSA
jgi:hypothetical protein